MGFSKLMNMLRKECFPKKTDKEEVAVFGMLVEALRIKHNPMHYDFKMRYVHYELPPEVVERLVNLHFVKNMEDLQEKYREAKEWFLKTMSEIDGKQIENLV